MKNRLPLVTPSLVARSRRERQLQLPRPSRTPTAILSGLLCALALGLMPQARAGSILLSDLTNPAIRQYDSTTGASLGVFVGLGNGLTTLSGITYGPEGNLYVCEYSDSKYILRYNGKTGAFLGIFATASAWPYDALFGPDGNLYVGLAGGGVQRFNGTTGASMGMLIPMGPDEFLGMLFHNGSILVTYMTSSNGQLRRYDATTGAFIATLYSGFIGNGPRAPQLGPDGNIYVPEWQTPHVAKFNGATLAYQGNLVDDPAHTSPIAVTFTPDGSFLVLDENGINSSVNRYNLATGAFLNQLIAPGSGGLGRAQYMISMPEPQQPPPLVIAGASKVGAWQQLQLTWTNNGVSCLLQGAGAITGGWNTVSTPWVTNANWVSTTVSNSSPAQFYRLRAN